MARPKKNLAIRKTLEPIASPDDLPADFGQLAGESEALHDVKAALDMLRRLLEAVRVKTILSYARGMCLACRFPHTRGVCRHNCACHEAVKFLAERGIKVDI
jgi:ABC-type antimicrobial peptide transport system ATPase subunit